MWIDAKLALVTEFPLNCPSDPQKQCLARIRKSRCVLPVFPPNLQFRSWLPPLQNQCPSQLARLLALQFV